MKQEKFFHHKIAQGSVFVFAGSEYHQECDVLSLVKKNHKDCYKKGNIIYWIDISLNDEDENCVKIIRIK